MIENDWKWLQDKVLECKCANEDQTSDRESMNQCANED